MGLPIKELKKLYHGALGFKRTHNYLRARRFTDDQIKYFQCNDLWKTRVYGSASITIKFITDAESFSFDYKMFYDIDVENTFEVYEDGFLTFMVKDHEIPTEGEITVHLKKGVKEVELYLPNYREYGIKNFVIDGNYEPVKKSRKRVLFIGDSITQGGGTLRSGQTFVNIVKRELNYDVLNQGVGAFIYDENVLKDIKFKPNKIIIALGTNNQRRSIEENTELVNGFFNRLNEKYKGIPTLVILPPFRNDLDPELLNTNFKNLVNIIYGSISKYNNIKVVNAYYMIPHFDEYFMPDRVHPNSFGAEIYARNLIKKIEEIKF